MMQKPPNGKPDGDTKPVVVPLSKPDVVARIDLLRADNSAQFVRVQWRVMVPGTAFNRWNAVNNEFLAVAFDLNDVIREAGNYHFLMVGGVK